MSRAWLLALIAWGCAGWRPVPPGAVRPPCPAGAYLGLRGEAELCVGRATYRMLLLVRRPAELHVLVLDPVGLPLWEVHVRGGPVRLPGLPSLRARSLVSLLMGAVPAGGRLYRRDGRLRLQAPGVEAEFRDGALRALRVGRARASYLEMRPDGLPRLLRLELPRGVSALVRYRRITPLFPSSR